MTTIYSWNVNGIRAAEKKGFAGWLTAAAPDILAVQETKAHKEQLGESLLHVPGYTSHWRSAQRKGYSGVAIYTRTEPLFLETLGEDEFDLEGRTLIAHYPEFILVNCYFPNSQPEGRRLGYKLGFCRAIHEKCGRLAREGKPVILCGDYNIAHTEIDLKNPKSNVNNPGFLPEEREWMTGFLDSGWNDIFRSFHPGEPDHYTWWSYRFGARERNIGWRIDYFCIDTGSSQAAAATEIHPDVMGSDHCPVSLTLDL